MSICSNCGHNDMESLSFLPPDTPVDSHAISSSAPPQLRAQLDKLNSTILRHKKRLAQLRFAVLQQHAYLEALETQQRELRMALAHIVYPVLTLPPEIISRIFAACLPDHGRVRPTPSAPPLLLAQICRQWRHISISLSELWSSADLRFPYHGDVENNWPLPLLGAWFSRAKTRPLSITIRGNYNDMPGPLFSLLSSVGGRLHTLELNLAERDFRYLEQENIVFTHLKRLAVFSYSHRTPDFHPLSAFSSVPSLTELRVQSEPPVSISNLYPSLTSVELGAASFRAVLTMLRQYPRLLHLRANVKDDMPAHFGNQPLLVPQLQSLIIRASNIDFLSLPGVRRLELDMDDTPVFSTLLPFIARSSCVLDHLALRIGPDDSASDLLSCLKAAPTLSSLRIDVSEDDRFIRLISCDPPVLSQLQTLQISATYENFDYLGFTQLLQLRRDDISPLARLESVQLQLVRIHTENALQDHWLPESVKIEFDKLITQGLKLRVTVDGRSYVWPEGDTGELDLVSIKFSAYNPAYRLL
ncbi:hypothetical protein DFH06DRAFT_1305973 [Mycena polygramma]|nr:hypothetical protein DFH06DRAFT_1305973 [Mycena polygramma]